jgi:hypothetical protein
MEKLLRSCSFFRRRAPMRLQTYEGVNKAIAEDEEKAFLRMWITWCRTKQFL